jgi:hypothetical protein
LDNFEVNPVPLVQDFISLAYDSRVVDKYIWTVLAPDKAIASQIIEPSDHALHLTSSLADNNPIRTLRGTKEQINVAPHTLWVNSFVSARRCHVLPNTAAHVAIGFPFSRQSSAEVRNDQRFF